MNADLCHTGVCSEHGAVEWHADALCGPYYRHQDECPILLHPSELEPFVIGCHKPLTWFVGIGPRESDRRVP